MGLGKGRKLGISRDVGPALERQHQCISVDPFLVHLCPRGAKSHSVPSSDFSSFYRYAVPGLVMVLTSVFYGNRTAGPSIAKIRDSNAVALSGNTYIPVAVFVGGTSGIGQAMAEAFARHTNGNAHIIIVGRNREAGERIIAGFPKPTSPSAKHEFVACDASLMKNIQETTTELLTRLSKINHLVLSTGILSLHGRDETEEGLDKKLAVHYYGRWKFIDGLVPALVKAKEAGEAANAFSVLGAGHGGPVDLEDFGLKKTFTEYALRYPSLSFAHAFPGHVRTNIMAASPSAFLRIASPLVTGPLSPFKRPGDAGEYLLNGLVNTTLAPGAWRIGEYGEDMGKTNYFGDAESRRRLWQHTVKATGSTENTK
ncbi:hypothetical protein D9757_010137 [Collybiopsis confluens]|uniref:NAD(P)-binding protein n=1 Tax=Collybiopsis confluens TaxID=2823264 RepID=A0A8H5GSS6_9AGAR|nr:hypothetical protein D9757_010137 [Collybiopsis confluens]